MSAEDVPTAGPPVGEPTDVSGVPDTALRSALEFAVGIVAAGQKLRPPLPYPVGMKSYLKFSRLDRMALLAVRRVVVADVEFRDRLGMVATTDLVDEIGMVWLQRPQGWPDTVRSLHQAAKDDADSVSTEAALRKAERRREAAEQAAARANAELIAHHDSLGREQIRREKAEQAVAGAASEVASLRNEIAGVRRELETTRGRLDRAIARALAAEQASTDATVALRAVEAVRDQILAQRVPEPVASERFDNTNGATASASVAAEIAAANRTAAKALQLAASATRDLATALATAGEAFSTSAVPGESVAPSAWTDQLPLPRHPRARAPKRKPIAIPGGVYGDSLAAATHLLRTPQAVVVVDGYNVAKLMWPTMELIDQRELCIDLLEDLVRRYGTDIRVVFDGADIVGAAARRRLIRVQFSPTGVSADDVIRGEVRALPASTPVVVVTNDQAIVNDVRADGANAVSSEMLLAVGGRSLRS